MIDRYAELPGWRRPLGYAAPDESIARQRTSLREAVYGVADVPMTAAELRAAIREEWGPASDAAIDSARNDLARYGEFARVDGGWVRVEVDEDEEVAL